MMANETLSSAADSFFLTEFRINLNVNHQLNNSSSNVERIGEQRDKGGE